jgi:hypothetical protein
MIAPNSNSVASPAQKTPDGTPTTHQECKGQWDPTAYLQLFRATFMAIATIPSQHSPVPAPARLLGSPASGVGVWIDMLPRRGLVGRWIAAANHSGKDNLKSSGMTLQVKI